MNEGGRAPDFANILFAGPCNRACPYCIGRRLPARVNMSNLDLFPPRNIDALVDAVNRLGVRQVVFTGTVSDPQLYRHEQKLLAYLRARIRTGAEYSLHTNGALALAKLDTFNLYDRACISFPSFDPDIYAQHMGSRSVPDLAAIVARARIPVKVSCVVNAHNRAQIPTFLARLAEIGVRRAVLRAEDGAPAEPDPLAPRAPDHWYRNNPVYILDGLEVTWWDFARTDSTSLNLFADGTLGASYRLTDTAGFGTASRATFHDEEPAAI